MIQSRPNELRPDEPAANVPGEEPKDRLRQHTDEAKRMAGDATRQAGESLREASRQAKDQITETARQTSAQVQERASTAVAHQKDRLADEIGVIGQALHRAADTLDENDDRMIGRYVHQAADAVDSFGRWLHDKNSGDMLRGCVRNCGDFTRRHPEVVLGGLFLAGVAVARFMKASERDRLRDESDFDYDREYGYMDMGRGLESEDVYGYRDTGYGDVGMYAGSDVEPYSRTEPFGTLGDTTLGDADLTPDLPRESASLTRNEDIPDVTSPQPGSYPPVTPSGTFFEETERETVKTNPTAAQDDDLNTIGRNEPSDTNPNKPR